MTIKNQETKDFWTNIVPTYSMIILGIIFLIISFIQSFLDFNKIQDYVKIQYSGSDQSGFYTTGGLTNYWDDTSGAITEYGSGGEFTGGASIEIPENPREYLEYIMEHGVGGVDYIVATPTNQPKMNSQTGDLNTQEMRNYIGNNKIKFEFNNKGKQGYIMFITTKPIRKAYKLFLGKEGKTLGYIDESTRIQSYELNEYLFYLNHIEYYWEKGKKSYIDPSKSPIHINAVSSEAGNKVEKIIIFFK